MVGISNAESANTTNVSRVPDSTVFQTIANQAHGFSGVNAAIKEYNSLTDKSAKNKFAETIYDNNKALGKYLSGLNGASGGLSGYTKALAAASLKTKALEAANTAFSTIVRFGTTAAIEAVISGIHYLMNYESIQQAAFENAKKATEEAAGSIRSLKSEMSDTSSKASQLSAEFANLVQGVNPFTNENENLSTEKYKRFLEVNNELAELFPSLTNNYDENGNAILGLSGNVDTVTASIQRLVEQQNNLAKADIREHMEEFVNGTDDTDGVFKVLEGQKNEVQDAETELKKFDDAYNGFINRKGTVSFSIDDSISFNEYLDYIRDMFGNKSYESLYNTYSVDGDGQTRYLDFSKLELDESTKEKIKKSYNTFHQDLQTELSIQQAELESTNKEMTDTMMTWVSDLELYNGDPFMNQVLKSMVGSIHWSDLPKNSQTLDGAKHFIQDNVLNPLSAACNDPDAKNALNSLFTFDFSELNYKEANEKIKGFLTVIMDAINVGKSEKEKKSLLDMYDMFNLRNYDQTTVDMKENLTGIAEEGSKDYKSLSDYTKDFNQTQTQAWLASTSGAKNAAEAIQMYEQYINQTGTSADETTEHITSMVNILEKMSTLQQNIKSIRSLYEEYRENGFVAAESIESIPDAFQSLPSFDLFSKIIGNPKSGKKKIKDAFDDIISEYMESQETLKGITEKDRHTAIANLESAGIQNASEVVSQYLKQSNDAEQEMNSLADITNQFDDAAFESFTNTISKKGKVSSEFIQKIGQNNANMINGLSKQYQTDLLNWLDLCRKKKEAYDILAGAVGGKNTKEAKSNLKKLVNKDESKLTSKDMGAYETATKAGFYVTKKGKVTSKTEKKADKILEDLKFKQVDADFDIDYNPKKEGGQDQNTSKQSLQQFDWINRALDRLSSNLDLVNAKYDNLFRNKNIKDSDALLTARNKNLDRQYRLLQKTEKAQRKAQKKYETKADKVKISKNKKEDKELKKAVEEGRIKGGKGNKKNLISAYGEEKAEKIQEYQNWYDKSKEAERNRINTQKEKHENRIQKIQNRVDNADSKVTLAQARKENETTAKGKNDQIKEEKKWLEKSYDYQIKIAKKEKDSLKVKELQVKKAKELRDLYIEQHQNLADEYQGTLDKYSAEKEFETTASGKNSIIEKEKGVTSQLYAEKIAMAQSEDEVLQLQANHKKELRDLDIEQHQNLADEYQGTLDKYAAQKDFATTAADKNNIIKQEAEKVNQLYAEKMKIAQIRGDKDEILQLQTERDKQIRDLKIEHYQNLADQYQGELDKSSAEKANLKTADEKNAVVEKEKVLTQQLYDEKIAIAHLEGDINEELKLRAEYEKELVTKEKEKFDNIAHYYENLMKLPDNSYKDMNNAIDELEARGLIVGGTLYSSQIELNKKKKESLNEELTLLNNQLSYIEEGTDEWYEAQDAIQACKNEIADTAKDTLELQKIIRNITWQVFEKISSRIDLISSEYDLLIKYMSDKKLVDDNTGSFTEEGTATLGAYLAQLELSRKKTTEFENDLNDLWDNIQRGEEGYTDQSALDEYYEKYGEYVASKSAEFDIEQNLINLMKEKYNAELGYLQDIINKRKGLLQAEKDEYDYRRTIEEKTKNVSTIAKQLNALSGDDSEAARTKIQQLKVSLDEAKQDLQDTEYDKWIADQQIMLDNLYNEYQDFIDDKLNDTNGLLREAVEYLKGDGIGTSIVSTFEKYTTDKYKPTKDTADINNSIKEGDSVENAVNKTADSIIEKPKQTAKDEEEASKVIKLISEIGEVDLDGEGYRKLAAAQKGYGSLSDEAKKIVDSTAENGYNTLKEKELQWGSLYQATIHRTDTNQKKPQTENKPQRKDNKSVEQQKEQDEKEKAKTELKNFIKNNLSRDSSSLQRRRFTDTLDQNGKSILGQIQKRIYNSGIKGDDKNPFLSDKAIANLLANDMRAIPLNGSSKSKRIKNTDDLLKYMNDIGFSDGGISDTLQKVPGMNGDDGWITLKKGEAILTPEQTKKFKKLASNLDLLNSSVDLVDTLSKPKADISSKIIGNTMGDVYLNVELPNVTNYEEFRRQMQSDPKIESMFKSMIWDKGSLSKYRTNM